MRRLILVNLVLLTLTLAASAAPSTKPTTLPTTTSTETASLVGGEIVFLLPPSDDGWVPAGHSNNGRTLAYARNGPSGNPPAMLAVNADLQPQGLTDDDANPIGQSICKRIRDGAKKGETEILSPPVAEKDDRFFLRIHHTFRKNGKVGDQLQLYRVVGLNLIAVAVTAYTDKPEEARPIFETAEKIVLSVKDPKSIATARSSTRTASKPVTLSEKLTTIGSAKLRLNAPNDWKPEIRGGVDSGIVATFHDNADDTNLLAISVRQLPPEAKRDPRLRDVIVDEIVNGEKTQFKIEGSTIVGGVVNLSDRRFLKKTRTKYQTTSTKFDVSSRQIRVGDEIVSVSIVCLDDRYEAIDKAADEVALSMTTTGKER